MKAWIAPLWLGCVSLAACSGPTQLDETTFADSHALVSESAVAEAGAQATASTTTGSAFFATSANAACTYSGVRTTCNGSGTAGTDTINWGSCALNGGLITMTGGWNEQFSGDAAAATCTVPIDSGETVARTSPTGSTASAMIEETSVSISTDTNGGTAYDGTTIQSGGAQIANSSGTYSISLAGLHRVAIVGSTKIFEHYILTTTPLSASGTTASTRQISSGVVVVYHQLARYKETLTFNGVQWTNSACCYPTAGYVSGQLSGSATGSTKLQFSSTCGTATFTDNDGSVSSYTLRTCH